MHEGLKLVLILLIAAVAATVLATLATRWLSEERRLARAFRHGLGVRPDAAILALGTGRGVALSLAAERIVTVWDGGGWRMDYPLAELIGAELVLDGEVAARVLKGEPRRLLDRQGAEREARLRFLFDHPRQPDFDLALWPAVAPRGGFAMPREAIAEANRWLGRIEAILRRAGSSPTVARPVPPTRMAAAIADGTPNVFDDEPLGEDADELAE